MSDLTDSEQKPHLYKPGQSGNPAGRPKGARSKLGESFIKELLADFEANGVEAIRTVRTKKPSDYVKVIASILPKEITGEDGGAILTKIVREIVRPSDNAPNQDG